MTIHYQLYALPGSGLGFGRTAERIDSTSPERVSFSVPAPAEDEAPYLENADYRRYKADVLAGVTVLDPAPPPPAPKSAILEVRVEDFRTTTGTQQTMVSWPLALQTLYTARFTLLAMNTVTADCRVWTAKATAKRVNGAALLVGTPSLETSHADAGAASWAVAADVSGNTFRVRVTGQDGQTISYSLVGEIVRGRPDGLVD